MALRALASEEALFGATGTVRFLAADFGNKRLLGRDHAALLALDLVEQETARQKTVQALAAFPFTSDLETRGPVHEHDGGRGLVDILAAVTTRVCERFREVGLADAKGRHSLLKLGVFLLGDGESAHALSISAKSAEHGQGAAGYAELVDGLHAPQQSGGITRSHGEKLLVTFEDQPRPSRHPHRAVRCETRGRQRRGTRTSTWRRSGPGRGTSCCGSPRRL